MRDNGDEPDGTPKPANPLVYLHLYLDLPQTSTLRRTLQTPPVQASMMEAHSECSVEHLTATDAPRVPAPSGVNLFEDIRKAITNPLSAGISISDILQFVYTNFPIVITIED